MSDKRSVATDALETLGTIIDETAGRDAIHLAVEPVMAGMALRPGEDVCLQSPGVAISANLGKAKAVGIVDPFLKTIVYTGQRFWLVVYPRQITSLRHVWTHTAFPDAKETALDKKDSESWLRRFVDNTNCPDYDTVIAAASGESIISEYDDDLSFVNDGESLRFRGREVSGSIPPEFWDHVEVVTGKKIDSDKRPSYFSCSC